MLGRLRHAPRLTLRTALLLLRRDKCSLFQDQIGRLHLMRHCGLTWATAYSATQATVFYAAVWSLCTTQNLISRKAVQLPTKCDCFADA